MLCFCIEVGTVMLVPLFVEPRQTHWRNSLPPQECSKILGQMLEAKQFVESRGAIRSEQGCVLRPGQMSVIMPLLWQNSQHFPDGLATSGLAIFPTRDKTIPWIADHGDHPVVGRSLIKFGAEHTVVVEMPLFLPWGYSESPNDGCAGALALMNENHPCSMAYHGFCVDCGHRHPISESHLFTAEASFLR